MNVSDIFDAALRAQVRTLACGCTTDGKTLCDIHMRLCPCGKPRFECDRREWPRNECDR